MIIIIFGPQGCGKGTQSELIAKKKGLLAFSMGDALRKEIKKGTVIGREIKKTVFEGKLVPAKITNNLLLKAMRRPEAKKGIILDGYPRNKKQLIFYSQNFKTDYAIELALSEKDSMKRISTRRICSVCSREYNIISLKPKTYGKCDLCNAKLIQREDDKPAAIKKRLKIYKKETIPLKKYYEKLGVLYVVDASRSITEVNKAIMNILSK